MSDFKSIPHFRFWCQKVLPLVYDNSLSYYELLCKVINYLNHIIDDVNQIPDIINELISDEKLKEVMTELLDELREQIARANEGTNTTASFDRDKGELVWLDGKLIVMTRDILAGDRYVEEVNPDDDITGNFVYTSIEEELNKIKNDLSELIEGLQEDVTQINNNIGELDNLDTSDKTNLVNAINEVNTIANIRYIFKTINEMKTADYDFKNGDIILVSNSTVGVWEVVDSVTEDLFNKTLLNGKTANFIKPSIVNIHALGVTNNDDISSIVQSLIDNNVKHIYIPEGTYTLEGVVINKAGVELYGSARGITTLECNTGNCITLDCRNTHVLNVQIHDLTINGNKSGYGLYVRGAEDTNLCDENTFYNLRITNCSRGLYWNSRGIWNIFRNVWFYGCARGMAVVLPSQCAFNHNSFYDCTWRGNTEKAFTIETSYTVKVNTIGFYHCNIESNYYGTDPSEIAAGTSACTIINCHSIKFDDCYFEANNTESVVSINGAECTIDTAVAYLTRRYFCRVVNNSSLIIENLYGHDASSHDLITSDSDATKVCVIGTGKVGFTLHTNITKYF